MFEKFGEFDSVEELNRAAAAQKEQGDNEAVIALAEENGIDREDAEEYIDGCVDELATPLMAASGKLKIEAEELEIKGILEDWKDEIVNLCTADGEICAAVRKKDRHIRDCMALLIRFAFENKVQVSNKIVNVTKVTHNGKEEPFRGPLYLGIPNRAQVRKIVREYYLGRQQ